MNTHTYIIYDLLVQTNFSLYPAPEQKSGNKKEPDLVIEKTNDESKNSNPEQFFVKKQIENGLIYSVKDVASYTIKKNTHIEIYSLSDKNDLIECILMERIIPLVLSSKGYSVFKGAAIYGKNGVSLLFGTSGVGTSTIAAGFYKTGCSLISDSFIVLKKSANEIKFIPSGIYMKLWTPVINQLHLNNYKKNEVRKGLNRFYADLPGEDFSGECTIKNLIFLRLESTKELNLRAKKLSAFEVLEELNSHLYITEENKIDKKAAFSLFTRLATVKNKLAISRPTARYNIKDMVQFINSNIYE